MPNQPLPILAQILDQLSSDAQVVLARVLLVLLALLIIWMVRSALRWLIVRPLRRMAERTSGQADEALLNAVIVPVRLVIIAFAVVISGWILEVGAELSSFLENLARMLFVIAATLMAYQLIDIFALSSRRLFSVTGLTIEERLIPFLRVAAKLILLIVGFLVVLAVWEFDISGLIAGIGLGGLAFSLAAQDTLSNLFGFTAIVGDRPFNVGDYIKTPDVEGVVEHVGLRSTQVRQLDQAVVFIPNNKLAQSTILNWSRLVKRRVDYTLGVTYETTSAQMRELLERLRDMLRAHPTVDPQSVQVYFMGFGDSALNVLVRAYVWKADWGEFHLEQEKVNLAVMDIVETMGLNIAFPSRTVYVEGMPAFIQTQIPDGTDTGD